MDLASLTFGRDQKYNGLHVCPRCNAASDWKGIDPDSRLIRVHCKGQCGTFEAFYSSLSDMPYFERD